MIVRLGDARSYPSYAPVMAEGRTYAFPPDQSVDPARPGAGIGRRLAEHRLDAARAFDHPEHGLVGLHVLHRYLR